MNNEVTKPIIYPDGTPISTLHKRCEFAISKLNEGINALEQCIPEKRDYYPYFDNDKNFEKATSEHYKRIQKIMDVRSEVSNLLKYYSIYM